jgi:lysozyme
MRQLVDEALALIEHFEGYHRRLPDSRAAPYLCPARVWTIGIGSTFYEDGRKITAADMPITHERAVELLAHELRQCEAAVDRLTLRRLHPLARGALVSFVYNCGSGAYRASGLRRAVNAGDDDRAGREFLKWRMAGGVVLPGLERRRRAEAALYLKGVNHEIVARGSAAGAGDSEWRVTVAAALRAATASAPGSSGEPPPGTDPRAAAPPSGQPARPEAWRGLRPANDPAGAGDHGGA